MVDKPHSNAGDLAVDGIITGIEAGLLMAAFLLVAAVLQGTSLSVVLAAFTLCGTPSVASGVLTHLAISSVYGILFNLSFYSLRRLGFGNKNPVSGPLFGLTFGTFLFLAAEYFLFDHAAKALKDAPLLLMLGAHLVYGLTLGLLLARRSKIADR